MRFLIVVLAVLLAAPVFADGQFECADLGGSWQGERFDRQTGSQQTSVVTFYQNGFVVFNHAYDSGSEITGVREYARWTCESDVLTIDYSDYDDTGRVDNFDIAELNSSYIAYRGVAVDCSERHGACGNIGYEMVKLPEALYGADEDCGC